MPTLTAPVRRTRRTPSPVPSGPAVDALRSALLTLAASARTPADYLAAADWFDRHHPAAPIPDRTWQRYPGWLVRAYRRSVPSPVSRGSRFVGQELAAALDPFLDHWGTAYVAGVAALVCEPYGFRHPDDLPGLIPHLRRLDPLVGGVGVYARSSAWNPPSTCRVLFLPHPDRWAEAFRGYGNRTRSGW